MLVALRDRLEALYAASNRRDLVHPDPLSFVHRYTDAGDREVAGFIASCLAYGRVMQIHQSVERVIGSMGESPLEYLMTTTENDLEEMFCGFVHRFTTGQELIGTLMGLRGVIDRYGSIERCVLAGIREGRTARPGHAPLVSGLCRLAGEINRPLEGVCNSLVPCPEKGSAVKRLNLYLRWMIRNDEVDLGVWGSISPAELIVPLDVHLFRIAGLLGLTNRRQADMKTACEVTDGFRLIAPGDPVKYDFALASLGIRNGADARSLMDILGVGLGRENIDDDTIPFPSR